MALTQEIAESPTWRLNDALDAVDRPAPIAASLAAEKDGTVTIEFRFRSFEGRRPRGTWEVFLPAATEPEPDRALCARALAQLRKDLREPAALASRYTGATE